MYIAGFDEMFRAVDARRSQVGVVAAGGDDRTVLEALSQAARRGWIQPIVTGDEAAIRKLADELRIDVSEFRIIDSDEPAKAAVAEIRDGRAALMMKGQISTPALMKAVLHRDTGLRTDRVIGQIVLLEIPRDDRRLLLTDTGITIQPTLDQKADLLRSLIETARLLKDEETPADAVPHVAVMSATEKPTDSMPDTLEAAELQKRGEAGEFPGGIVQGPLSFDLAYAPEAGEKKKIAGQVVGDADAMLFPNLLAANLTVKAIMYTAECRFGGYLCGTSAPVVFMSRADTTSTRMHSLAFTLQMLHVRGRE
ncbi:phosphate acyltransferase [Planctellipticum variicoloris]|uniref:phosphate acyltransferase n=1 Tax=Planctellipticum variicoloris TaxID=3064265 RepID=UPI003013F56B|nr:phosphate acyltransferase [Planctomycetaceae bacterium SH412]